MSLPDFLEQEERTAPTISKTRYMSGVLCERKLYLSVHEPTKAAPEAEMDKTIQELGQEVHHIAHERYPGAEVVDVNPSDLGPAVQRTRELMADPKVGAIFEATLISNGEQACVDILERQPDSSWHVVEIKSGSKIKPAYKQDAAMQYRVLKNAGVDVRKVRLLQPDKDYVLGKGDVDPKAFFKDVDITAHVIKLAAETAARLERQKQLLTALEAPVADVGKHCEDRKRPCVFFAHCHQNIVKPEHPVETLYDIRAPRLKELKSKGYTDIRQIPMDYKGLTDKQMLQRKVLEEKKPFHDHAKIEAALSNLVFPIHFLDFETILPGIPLYPGTKPYEIMPIQFSNHTLMANGRTYHKEFLHALDSDPRERFIKNLIKTLKQQGSIIVYSAYEMKRLETLAESFPQYKADLDAIMARFVDLLPIVQDNTYYPEYDGSYSLKKVLPVFVKSKDLSYDGLSVKNGNEASVAFLKMIHPDTTPKEKMDIGISLRRYCATDTEALLRLFYELAPGVAARTLAPAKKSRKKAASVKHR